MNITTSKAEFSSYSTNEWIVDFDEGSLKDPSGDINSIIQDIRFTLGTERYKYPIMGSNFGVTFDDLIGTDYAYVRSEIMRRIQDAFSIDDRIISVSDFEFTKTGSDGINVKCKVVTVLGNVDVSTSIIS